MKDEVTRAAAERHRKLRAGKSLYAVGEMPLMRKDRDLLADAYAQELDQTPLTAEFVSGCKLSKMKIDYWSELKQFELHYVSCVGTKLTTRGQLRTACRLFGVTLTEKGG